MASIGDNDDTKTFSRTRPVRIKSKTKLRRRKVIRQAQKNTSKLLQRSKYNHKTERTKLDQNLIIHAWESSDPDHSERKIEKSQDDEREKVHCEEEERELLSSPSESSSDGVSVMSFPGEECNDISGFVKLHTDNTEITNKKTTKGKGKETGGVLVGSRVAHINISRDEDKGKNHKTLATDSPLIGSRIALLRVSPSEDKEKIPKSPTRVQRSPEQSNDIRFSVNGVSSTLNTRTKMNSNVPRKSFQPLWKLDQMFLVSSDFPERSLDLLHEENTRQQKQKNSPQTNIKQQPENLPTLSGKSLAIIPRKPRADSAPIIRPEYLESKTDAMVSSAPSSVRNFGLIDVNNVPEFQNTYKHKKTESGNTAEESLSGVSHMNSHRNKTTCADYNTIQSNVSLNVKQEKTNDKTSQGISRPACIPHQDRNSSPIRNPVDSDMKIQELCIRGENSGALTKVSSGSDWNKVSPNSRYHNGPKELLLRQASKEYLSTRLMCELDSVLNASVTSGNEREAKISPSVTRRQSLAAGKLQSNNEQTVEDTAHVTFAGVSPEEKTAEHHGFIGPKQRPKTSYFRTQALLDTKLQKRVFVTFDDVTARVRPVSLRNPADPLSDRCRKINYQLKNIELKEIKKNQRQKERLLKKWIKETNTENDAKENGS